MVQFASKEGLPKHTCSSCGFLAALDYTDNSAVDTAGLWFRKHGHQIVGAMFEGLPMCYVLAQPIHDEARALAPPNQEPTAEQVTTIIQKPRGDCPEWMEWVPWLPPKEHREMLDRERMLQWQAEREEADRSFRESERRSNRRYRLAELVLVIVTIAVILVAAFVV